MLRGAGAGLGAAALAPVLGLARRPADAAQARLTARAAANRITDFGQGWKFALVNPDGITDPTGAYANAMDPGFDDSGWRQLDVPHDWSIELAPVDNASTSSATGFLPGGLAWYRKHFTLPKSLAGQRISIEFDGVYRNSNVYLNGKLLGNHPYAYTGFSYDLTGLVHTDGVTEDVIAVSAADQQPSSRWYSGDGIFRNVYLVTTGAGPRGAARHVRDHARPARHAQLRLRDRPGGHRRHQRGVRRGVGAGGGDPHQPGGEDRRAGQHHGQRPRRADPDRDGQPEGDQPRAVVHRPARSSTPRGPTCPWAAPPPTP